MAPRFNPANRWYHRLHLAGDHAVWLLTWLPGQGTDLHDHGGSAGDARLPFADGYHLDVIVTCQEGYTSSPAAAGPQDLGLTRATDLAGGFAAGRDASLPVTRGG